MIPRSDLDRARGVLHDLAATAGAAPPGHVRLELDDSVARVVIDAPASRNALSTARMAQLGDAVAELYGWPGAVIRVESAVAGAFCAGGHLGEVASFLADPARGVEMATAMGVVTEALRRLPAVSVSVVDGPALGGGAELCTATDARFLGARGRIGFVQARLGVACGWGGSARLVALVGPTRALALLVRGEVLGPAEAFAVGLADGVDAVASAAADAWLAPVQAAPPEAIRAVKRQVVAALPPYDAAAAVAAFGAVWGGPAHAASLQGRR